MSVTLEQHGDKRAAILRSAAGFFAEMGYDRASMRALAEVCGVSKGLLYHYFSSKDEILHAVLATHLMGLREAILAVQASDHRQQFLSMAVVLLQRYEGTDNEHHLQLNALKLLSEDDQNHLKDIQREIVRAFRETIMALGGEESHLQAEQCRALTMSVFGMLNWRYLWHHPRKDLSVDQFAQLCLDMVLGGIAGAKAGEGV